MKKLSTLFTLLFVVLCCSTSASATTWSLVGAFNGWNTATAPDFTDKGNGVYELTNVDLISGGFKVIADHSWSVQYGAPSSSSKLTIGKEYSLTKGNNPANINFATDANYNDCTVVLTIKSNGAATLLITAGSSEAVVIDTWTLVGEMTDNWQFNEKYNFTDKGNGVWELSLPQLYGEFGIFGNNSWNIGLKSNGSAIELGKEYELSDGGNISFEDKTVLYTNVSIRLTITDTKKTLLITGTAGGVVEDSYNIAGEFNSWDITANPFESKGNGVYELSLPSFSGEFKIVKNGSWNYNYGTNGSDVTVKTSYLMVSGADNAKMNDVVTNCKITLTVTGNDVTIYIDGRSASNPDEYYLIGDFNEWNATANKLQKTDDGVYELQIERLFGDFQIGLNGSTTDFYGSNGTTFVVGEEYIPTYGGGKISLGNAELSDVTVFLNETETGIAIIMSGTESINDIVADNISIATSDRYIYVNGADNVAVYSINGTLIGNNAKTEVASGIYIVVADGKTCKVVVK